MCPISRSCQRTFPDAASALTQWFRLSSFPPEALMDILQQDRRESAEQRQELCDIITRLQGDLQSTEEQRDKVGPPQGVTLNVCPSSLGPR